MTEANAVLARLRARGYRRVKSVDLFDPSLIERHAALEAELQRVAGEDHLHNRPAQAPVVAREIEALEEEIESTALSFKFGALTYREYYDLLAAHPPTKAQLRDQSERSTGGWSKRAALDHNPMTFPSALVSACLVDPEMDEDQAAELVEVLGPDQFEILYGACIEVNKGGGGAPKSMVAGAILRVSGQSDDTPAPEESPEATS